MNLIPMKFHSPVGSRISTTGLEVLELGMVGEAEAVGCVATGHHRCGGSGSHWHEFRGGCGGSGVWSGDGMAGLAFHRLS